MLRETTSRGLRGLVCPSHTSERGGKGYCVKGGEEEGERERERALGMQQVALATVDPRCRQHTSVLIHVVARPGQDDDAFYLFLQKQNLKTDDDGNSKRRG